MIDEMLQGFKVGLCDKRSLGSPNSVLCLNNSCAIASTFGTMATRFGKLFKRQVYVHHYTQFMETQGMVDAQENVAALRQAYSEVEMMPAPKYEDMYVPRGMSFL